MNLLETLDYFIDDTQAHVCDLEWEIREETNYDNEGHEQRMEYFCEQYDEHKARLDDLMQIKSVIEHLEANK